MIILLFILILLLFIIIVIHHHYIHQIIGPLDELAFKMYTHKIRTKTFFHAVITLQSNKSVNLLYNNLHNIVKLLHKKLHVIVLHNTQLSNDDEKYQVMTKKCQVTTTQGHAVRT